MKKPTENSELDPKLPAAKAKAPVERKKKQRKGSPEQEQEALFLIQSRGESIQQAAERKKKQLDETVELLSGQLTTVGGLNGLHIQTNALPYEALFPNSSPFFEHLLRLNWPGADPKKYVKPPGVGQAIIEIIYGRFPREVFPILNVLNPRKGGYRARKLFQHLDANGQALVVQYRDEAIEIMKTCADLDWIGFRQKLFNTYGVPYQTELFGGKTKS